MKYIAIAFLLIPAMTFSQTIKLRGLSDTVGFAHLPSQMDAIASRTESLFGKKMETIRKEQGVKEADSWKVAVSPHDDYTYASYMYPLVLQNVKARTVILFGVAHKSKQFGLQDKIIFDSFAQWHGCYGNIPVSSLREKIISKLPKEIYEVNDSMQTVEHSVEGILPWIQYYNRQVNIISILVPYNSFENMDKMAASLSSALAAVMKENQLEWGKDLAFVLSSDAVHYGDEDWGGKNFAFMGADTAGYEKAVAHEKEIIAGCLTGTVSTEKIRKFTEYTVKPGEYKEYQWTWCGRYSVPMGLLTALHLSETLNVPLTSVPLDYCNSISVPHIKVDDLKMGITAPAKLHHWVGYASVGIR